MESLEEHGPRIEQANALYWESNRSVSQIADEMEVSKGMLYELIRPLPSGLPCPRCSSDMEFSNRTARERGLVTCSSCRFEDAEDAVRAAWTSKAAAEPSGKLVVTPQPRPRRLLPTPPDLPARSPLMVGAGILLIATGIWLFSRLRKPN